MAYNFYSNYMDNIYQSPTQNYLDSHQAAIDYIWENSSLLRKIKGQYVVGKKEYKDEELLIDYVIDPKTGEKFGDDYRRITYKNVAENSLPPSVLRASRFLVSSVAGVEVYQYKTSDGKDFYVREKSDRWLGKYYMFDGTIWLIINTMSYVGTSIEGILARCNNTLQWINENGDYYCWPCVFKRTLSGTQINYGKQDEGVPQIKADTIIQVQRNSDTNQIQINQRLLFDGQAFQVNEINNHISDTYMELYCFATQLQSNDDIENNIANAKDAIVPQTNNAKISPLLAKITQGNAQEYSVFNYVNGMPTNEEFGISGSGSIVGVNYELTIVDGNHFVIKNLAMSLTPLLITCIGQTTGAKVDMEVTLGGLW